MKTLIRKWFKKQGQNTARTSQCRIVVSPPCIDGWTVSVVESNQNSITYKIVKNMIIDNKEHSDTSIVTLDYFRKKDLDFANATQVSGIGLA
ncbi:MAG: hypothetical protein FWH21_02525 [Kiritimatiellaeota bacterium]|nr:hypothetical protein [Kiritimatiellota bacterium]